MQDLRALACFLMLAAFFWGQGGGEHSTVHEPLPHQFLHLLGGWEETTPSREMTTGHDHPWPVSALSFLKNDPSPACKLS